jgi:DNA repair photolyase
MIPAAYLEHEVWQDCRNFILNPGEALAEAQCQLRERLEQVASIEAERERLQVLLAEKEAEREGVTTLFRQGSISLNEAEVQLDAVGREMADLRALTDSLAAQVELVKAWEARVVEATVLLAQLRERLADIEARDDWDAKRQGVEMLVQEVTVQTERDGKQKRGTITIRYVFGEPRHAVRFQYECQYCYARAFYARADHGDASADFPRRLLVRRNIAAVLRAELRRPSWRGETIALGTATDCYQPIEARYRLMPGVLRVLCDWPTPVGIVTKAPLLLRDLALWRELAALTSVRVYYTVTTLDAALWRSVEPGTPNPWRRLAAVRLLNAAGVPAGVLMAPLLPGLTDSEEQIARVAAAAAEHGAAFFDAGPLRLAPGVRDHFFAYLAGTFPALLPRYRRAYWATDVPAPYRARLAERVAAVRARYGFAADPQRARVGARAEPGLVVRRGPQLALPLAAD